MSLKQKLLILAFQHSIRHYRWAARFYQTLAFSENNMNSRATLLTLSRNASLHARIDMAGLTLLHAPIPNERDSTTGDFWDGVLLHFNITFALAWLGWVEESYDWLVEVLTKK
jgi:hypothetical protein